jgi:peptidoglycan/xylan/chitin deacetylase (PgdA/CDA1 family)
LDAILPVLAHHDVHATFFLIGRDMEKHPGFARRLAANGHELGNHSYSHARMWFHGPAWYDREITRTDALLRHEGVTHPRLFRPPYGKKLIGLPAAVERADLLTVTWDVEEPSVADPATYARLMLAQVRPGSIILVHAMYRNSAAARQALPLLLTGLQRKGYRIVPVGTLLSARDPR